MISLAPVNDKSIIKKMFEDNSVEYGEQSGCLTAIDSNGLLGFSLYSLDNDKMIIYKIFPEDDISLADGILRSTLHIAAQRSIMTVFYTEASEKICKKLSFIKNSKEKTLDVDKLFIDCCCKK